MNMKKRNDAEQNDLIIEKNVVEDVQMLTSIVELMTVSCKYKGVEHTKWAMSLNGPLAGNRAGHLATLMDG